MTPYKRLKATDYIGSLRTARQREYGEWYWGWLAAGQPSILTRPEPPRAGVSQEARRNIRAMLDAIAGADY